MPLDPALSRLIGAKLAHTRAPQWELPIADVRKAFRDLWTRRSMTLSPRRSGPARGPAIWAPVIAAEYDTLRDEDEAYAKRLRGAGVATGYRCYAGMVHGFLQMGGIVAEAGAAVDEIAEFVNGNPEHGIPVGRGGRIHEHTRSISGRRSRVDSWRVFRRRPTAHGCMKTPRSR